MLRPRIIPCLLIKDGGLVKTINFKDEKYVGDPINVVKILNEKEVDELIILDIDASKSGCSINFNLIENIATECRMPLCYGGGVKNLDDISKLIQLGVEKVAISSAIFKNINFLSEAAKVVGNQSIVVVLDVKEISGNYYVFLKNGKENTGILLTKIIPEIIELGVGEIVINSIDRDGTMIGYDFKLLDQITKIVTIPLTIIGGASGPQNIKELFLRYGNIGSGVGSYFVFKGKYRAVLVNYPTRNEKFQLTINLMENEKKV